MTHQTPSFINVEHSQRLKQKSGIAENVGDSCLDMSYLNLLVSTLFQLCVIHPG